MEEITQLKPLEVLESETEKKRKQMEEEFSYDGYKYVRSELFPNLREPAITIRNGNVTFNTACVNGLEEVVYVNLLLNEDLKRLVVKGCSENDKDAIRWCVAKPDKRKSRKITCPDFTKLIYDLMGWEKQYRYKIKGYLIEVEGEKLYVFDFTVHKIFQENVKEKADGHVNDESKPAAACDRKGFYPQNIANTFGVSVEEHENMLKIEKSLDGYISVGALTGKTGEDKEAVLENGQGLDSEKQILENADKGDQSFEEDLEGVSEAEGQG